MQMHTYTSRSASLANSGLFSQGSTFCSQNINKQMLQLAIKCDSRMQSRERRLKEIALCTYLHINVYRICTSIHFHSQKHIY